MARKHLTFALVTLLSGAPLLTGIALAEPAGARDRTATPTMPSEPHGGNPAGAPTPPVPNVDQSAPTTPMPINLPDEAKTSEVKGQYGLGIAGLILGTVLITAFIGAGVYFMTRRSWSARAS